MPLNTPPLETERLILRKFTPNDLDAIFSIFRDEEVNRFLPWYPLKTMEEARSFFLERYAAPYGQERGYRYAVCLRSDNSPVGYVNVAVDDSHDLGYGLRKEFWHQGIITEACQAVIQQLRVDGIPYLTATHDRNNPRSGRVMQNLGMKYQYSYEELWQPKNIRVIFRMYQLNLDGQTDRQYKKYWDTYDHHFIEPALSEGADTTGRSDTYVTPY